MREGWQTSVDLLRSDLRLDGLRRIRGLGGDRNAARLHGFRDVANYVYLLV